MFSFRCCEDTSETLAPAGETAATNGGSRFRLVDGKYQMQSQSYHYKMRNWDSNENIKRNLATKVGHPTSIIRTPYGVMPTHKVFKPYYINIKY